MMLHLLCERTSYRTKRLTKLLKSRSFTGNMIAFFFKIKYQDITKFWRIGVNARSSGYTIIPNNSPVKYTFCRTRKNYPRLPFLDTVISLGS